MPNERLEQQIRFLTEIDKLKHIQRQTVLMDCSRQENDAEHSWHIAVLAMVLAETANTNELNLLRVLQMLLIHDIVEIDAGDTYCYDEAGRKTQAQREQQAADRLFGLLPSDQAQTFRAIWDEFEARETAESRFANAVDRFQPLLHNLFTDGHAWRKHGIHRGQVDTRNRPIRDGSAVLWEHLQPMLDRAVEQAHLKPVPKANNTE